MLLVNWRKLFCAHTCINFQSNNTLLIIMSRFSTLRVSYSVYCKKKVSALRTACAIPEFFKFNFSYLLNPLSNVNSCVLLYSGHLPFASCSTLFVTLSLCTVAVFNSWNPIAKLSAAKLTLHKTPAAVLTAFHSLIPAHYGFYRVDETKHHTHNTQASRPSTARVFTGPNTSKAVKDATLP